MSLSVGEKEHDTVRNRILRFLTLDPSLDYQPKLIALRIKRHHEAVRKALARMLDEEIPPIVQTHRGWYRIAWGIDELKNLENEIRVGLHGLKLQAYLPEHRDADNTPLSLSPQKFKEYRKRLSFKDFNFMGYPVTVTVHQTGLVEVFLNSSNNPIGFLDFEKFKFFLQGRFSSVIDWNDWDVVQWGLNADINNMRIEGAKSVKLQVFRDAWFQLYQKREDVVRAEVHSTKSIQAEDIYKWFRTLTDCANGKPLPAPPAPEQEYTATKSYDYDPSYG
jgi:hypothetical protein